MRTRFILLAAVAAMLVACGPKVGPEPVGKRADALDASAWDVSQWISVVNAPARVLSDENGDRAADGASWFLSTVKNGKKVTKAVWMTAGLGVYDLYVNGKLVGEEVLKPGFTHYAKTKRSFTYDITDAFVLRAGKENVLSAQVTPGWWADKIVSNRNPLGDVPGRSIHRVGTLPDGFGTDLRPAGRKHGGDGRQEDVVKVRDLWRQKDLPMGLYHIAPHGVLFLKVTVK